MKLFSILILFFGITSDIAVAIPKDTMNFTKVDPIRKVYAATDCTVDKGYLISLSIGYNGYTNWTTYTIKDDKGTQAWYWGANQVDSSAGKSMLATAIYAASSGQKVLIQCDTNNYIKSLWVGPN
ncbi:hypothetical protein [Xenorhabdus sp. KJ12.1]|uniref:hypothetical protein n=1 Tax=Xenorhabdus sp. KJ12.1 TaxID=1851571 RepID=UPI000C050FB1|nr:hypothetical protein [Xenorhabdus sp. KJ12.1]PHM72367.1 hypothetical protein Xekj_00646 [Xenorhabdus sp. KJ12.1]